MVDVGIRALIYWATCILAPVGIFWYLSGRFNKYMDYQKAVDKAAKISFTIAGIATIAVIILEVVMYGA